MTPTSCWPVLASSGVKPLRGLVTAVTILLVASAAAAAALAVTAFYRARLADRFLDHGDVSLLDDIDQADGLVQGTAILYLLTLIPTGILFIMWQHRYAKNADRLGGKLGLGPGWAIGGWFIPVAGPVLAAVQLSQAARQSDDRRGVGFIPAWVVAWFIGGTVGWVGAAMRPDNDNPGDLRDFARADRVTGVGAALIAVAGVLAVVMVRQLSAGQTRAAQRRAAALTG